MAINAPSLAKANTPRQQESNENIQSLQSDAKQSGEAPQSASSLVWEMAIILVIAFIALKWVKNKFDD